MTVVGKIFPAMPQFLALQLHDRLCERNRQSRLTQLRAHKNARILKDFSSFKLEFSIPLAETSFR